jgi:glycosyltransferase involved in cell wall biosynthesis
MGCFLPTVSRFLIAPPISIRVRQSPRECALRPDFIHVASLFEGFEEEVVTSVGQYFPGAQTAVTLYDLIPLVHSTRYLPDSKSRDYYERKIENIKNAGLLLAISEYSRLEGIDLLGCDPEDVVNISSAADERFKPTAIEPARAARLLSRYGIRRKFLMYTASFDSRKNQTGLISAFALFPRELRQHYQLAIVGNGSDEAVSKAKLLAEKSGLGPDEVVFPGHIVDGDLVALYNLCHLFILPSLSEGFGLPALEAMACGTATIGSNVTSLPEVIGWSEALFDPTDPAKIAEKIYQALTDDDFLEELRQRGLAQAKTFSWARCADRAFDAYEASHERSEHARTHTRPRNTKPSAQSAAFQATDNIETVVSKIAAINGATKLTNQDLLEIADTLASNRARIEAVLAKPV